MIHRFDGLIFSLTHLSTLNEKQGVHLPQKASRSSPVILPRRERFRRLPKRWIMRTGSTMSECHEKKESERANRREKKKKKKFITYSVSIYVWKKKNEPVAFDHRRDSFVFHSPSLCRSPVIRCRTHSIIIVLRETIEVYTGPFFSSNQLSLVFHPRLTCRIQFCRWWWRCCSTVWRSSYSSYSLCWYWPSAVNQRNVWLSPEENRSRSTVKTMNPSTSLDNWTSGPKCRKAVIFLFLSTWNSTTPVRRKFSASPMTQLNRKMSVTTAVEKRRGRAPLWILSINWSSLVTRINRSKDDWRTSLAFQMFNPSIGRTSAMVPRVPVCVRNIRSRKRAVLSKSLNKREQIYTVVLRWPATNRSIWRWIRSVSFRVVCRWTERQNSTNRWSSAPINIPYFDEDRKH